MKLTRLIVPCVLATALLQGCASSSSTKETSTEDNKTTSNAATTSTEDTNASLKNNNVANPTAFLTETVAAAKKGQLPNVPFTVGQTTYTQVEEQWGKPNLSFLNTANYVQYRVAKKEQIAYGVGIGRGHILYELRAFVADDGKTPLSSISFKAIKKQLGQPTIKTKLGPDRIWSYAAGNFMLKFTGSTKDHTLHHISVYSKVYDDSKQ